MSFWTDGENDRDVHQAYDPHAETTVPCKRCRTRVQVIARDDSIFATHLCARCEREAFATQDRKAAAHGKDAA